MLEPRNGENGHEVEPRVIYSGFIIDLEWPGTRSLNALDHGYEADMKAIQLMSEARPWIHRTTQQFFQEVNAAPTTDPLHRDASLYDGRCRVGSLDCEKREETLRSFVSVRQGVFVHV